MAHGKGGDVMEAAGRLLARRSLTRHELSVRLQGKGYSRDDSDRAVERLAAWGYLDDAEIARRAVEDCLARRPRGRELLRLELAARGIPSPVVDEALAGYPPQLERRVAAAALARRGIALPIAAEERPRAWRILSRMGFAEHTIEGLCGSADA